MKMSKKVKKVVCSLAVVGCLLGNGAIAYADTTYFTLTVTKSGEHQDRVSKRTRKAGGSAYENKFYVTPTSFSGDGAIYVDSINLYNNQINSPSIQLTNRSNATKSESYRQYAPSGQYYYLEGLYGGSMRHQVLNVQGRYTP